LPHHWVPGPERPRHVVGPQGDLFQIGAEVLGGLGLRNGTEDDAQALLQKFPGSPLKAHALGVLTGFTDDAEEVDEVEDLLADGVRLATKVGDTAAARTLADRATALAEESEIPHRQANALCCRGLVDHDAGRLLRAAERYHDARRPLLGAKALEAAAGALVDTGDRDPARAAFSRAVDLYSSLGATRDVARLQARFRAAGIRRAPRVKHQRAHRGWESLTPAEVKIAARLFLSHRTVATHVSHILGKLNVRSRIDIARESADRRAAAAS